jgi:hypothetical protein
MADSISNYDDIIDSRDVLERIDDLEGTEFEDEQEELSALRELALECEGVSDWEHGTALIRDSYFVSYAEELAEDLYDMNQGWPFCHIDWDAAAETLKQDYINVEFDGTTYWVRS